MTDPYYKPAHQLISVLLSSFAVHGGIMPEPYNQQIKGLRQAMENGEIKGPLMTLAETICEEWYETARTGNLEDDCILRLAHAILLGEAE